MKLRLLALLILAALTLAGCNFSLAEDLTPPPGYVHPTAAPTTGPLYPAQAPNPARGASIYAEKCLGCHGEAGLGNGPQAVGLPVPVSAIGLGDISRQSTPAEWFTLLTLGRMDRYMPPFTSLTEQQRWDVLAYVYTLSASPDEAARGAELYALHCAECHGTDGTGGSSIAIVDQQRMAQFTAIGLYQAISNGKGDMPAFDRLGESDTWALAAHLRNLTFDLAAAAEPTATPLPPVESPIASPAEPSPLPQGEGTPVVDTSPTPQASGGTVTGRLVNASGGSLPPSASVTLYGYEHGSDESSPTEILDLTVETAADGSFQFDEVELGEGRFFVAEFAYDGIPYQSGVTVSEAGSSLLELGDLVFYETTTDTSALSMDQVHIIYSGLTAGLLEVYEIYIFSNTGERAVVVDTDGAFIPFIVVPEGAGQVSYEDAQVGGSFLPSENGFAIPPSAEQYGIQAYYTLPYERKLQISRAMALDVLTGSVLLPPGMKVSGDQLGAGEAVDMGSGQTFQVYEFAPIPAGGALDFTLSGQPDDAPAATAAGPQNTLVIGLAGFGLLLLAVGVALYLRDRARSRLDDGGDEDGEPDSLNDPDSILDAIITLDEQHKNGAIAEDAYRNRRAELKGRLKDLV